MSQIRVFWQALLVTVFIFAAGIVVGIILENMRLGKVQGLYEQSEIDLLDIKLQSEIYSSGKFNCSVAIKENLDFAERVYEEAKILDRYEQASRLTEKLAIEHKKYDILRAVLFLNSLKIKKQCNSSYHNVVYFYSYSDPRLEIKARQNVFSKLLKELKEKRGEDILLIPMAGNNNVISIKIILSNYKIKEEDLPVILIDEKIKVTELETLEELEKRLK